MVFHCEVVSNRVFHVSEACGTVARVSPSSYRSNDKDDENPFCSWCFTSCGRQEAAVCYYILSRVESGKPHVHLLLPCLTFCGACNA